jgi:hypothetical protein
MQLVCRPNVPTWPNRVLQIASFFFKERAARTGWKLHNFFLAIIKHTMITKRKKIKKMEINIKERERERIYTTTRSTSGNRRSRERKSNTHIQQILASPCCGFSSSVCLSPHICTYALSHDGSGRSHIQRPC